MKFDLDYGIIFPPFNHHNQLVPSYLREGRYQINPDELIKLQERGEICVYGLTVPLTKCNLRSKQAESHSRINVKCFSVLVILY